MAIREYDFRWEVLRVRAAPAEHQMSTHSGSEDYRLKCKKQGGIQGCRGEKNTKSDLHDESAEVDQGAVSDS